MADFCTRAEFEGAALARTEAPARAAEVSPHCASSERLLFSHILGSDDDSPSGAQRANITGAHSCWTLRGVFQSESSLLTNVGTTYPTRCRACSKSVAEARST